MLRPGAAEQKSQPRQARQVRVVRLANIPALFDSTGFAEILRRNIELSFTLVQVTQQRVSLCSPPQLAQLEQVRAVPELLFSPSQVVQLVEHRSEPQLKPRGCDQRPLGDVPCLHPISGQIQAAPVKILGLIQLPADHRQLRQLLERGQGRVIVARFLVQPGRFREKLPRFVQMAQLALVQSQANHRRTAKNEGGPVRRSRRHFFQRLLAEGD